MKDLVLNLKGIYFDDIQSGAKLYEFRLANDYWNKRLLKDNGEYKDFNRILIRRGYPKAGDSSRELVRNFTFAQLQTVTHPHFGPDPVRVHAIRVN